MCGSAAVTTESLCLKSILFCPAAGSIALPALGGALMYCFVAGAAVLLYPWALLHRPAASDHMELLLRIHGNASRSNGMREQYTHAK